MIPTGSDPSAGNNDALQEQPAYKGEIYFSNPPKSSQRVSGPAVAAKATNSKKKKKKKRDKPHVFVWVLLGGILLSSIVLSSIAISFINDILAIGRNSEIVTVVIPDNADTKTVIKILHENDLIKQRFLSNRYISFVADIRKTSPPKYIQGVYYVNANMGLEAMLNEFKAVQAAAKTVKLVFPEGWTIYQIIDKIDEYKVCDAKYLYTAIDETDFNYFFVRGINDSELRTQKYEGYFFPDTYEFFVNENANSVVRRFFTNFESKWKKEYTKKAEELGLSIDEVLIIASIIQKEAANSEQMGMVSSVIHNRLNKAEVFPALECDATKDYISRFVRPVVGNAAGDRYMAAYNTYSATGLPPGPICNPGIKAIEAALNPKQTDYYYFQHDKTGKIYMAKTLREHNENTLQVLRANNS